MFVGCATMTTLQTAESLDKGEAVALVGGFISEMKIDSVDEVFDSVYTWGYPDVEAAARYGVTDNFDIGIKAFVIGMQADGKYRFLNKDKFSMAGDLAIGYTSVSSETDTTKYIDFIPSVLLTAKLHKYFSITASPKTLFGLIIGDETSINYLFGGTVGLKLGDKTSLIPEVGFFKGKYYDLTQYGVAIQYKLK
jgi:hypothetical protein